MRKLVWASIALALAGAALHYLGVLDRPPFVATTFPDLVAIVAVSDAKDVGGNIMRLLEGTVKGIHAEGGSANKMALKSAAARYGSPAGAQYVSVGLYLDDPSAADRPRWAVGCAIDVPSFEKARSIADAISSVDGAEPVRAVRVPLTTTLSARVPWRSLFTPMIAPALHWKRGFAVYKGAEGMSAPCGPRHAVAGGSDGDCPVALEAYVTGLNGSREWIDYTIVAGDTAVTWDDLFPESQQERAEPPQQHHTEESSETASAVDPPPADGAEEPQVEQQREAQEEAAAVSDAEPDSVEAPPDPAGEGGAATQEEAQHPEDPAVADEPPPGDAAAPAVEEHQGEEQHQQAQEAHESPEEPRGAVDAAAEAEEHGEGDPTPEDEAEPDEYHDEEVEEDAEPAAEEVEGDEEGEHDVEEDGEAELADEEDEGVGEEHYEGEEEGEEEAEEGEYFEEEEEGEEAEEEEAHEEL
jgi:hypothetical protein